MGEKHPNAKHDDETWMGFFERWHAGETSAALRAEAGVSRDTWAANAARLKMRRKDLPEDHPGRRPYPPIELRDPAFRHPNSILSEGQWLELFEAARRGVSWVTLCRAYGVSRTAVACQAANRGLRLCDLTPPREGPAVYDPRAVGGPVHADDPERTARETMERYERAAEEGRLEDAVAIEKLDRANHGMLGRRKGAEGRPPHPGAEGAVPSPEGEGEVVLHDHQKPPEGDWGTWLVVGGRGAGKTLAGASWVAARARALGAGGRIALVGATLHDVREVMIEGPSGLKGLACWGGAQVVYEPSRRRVLFPGGCEGHVFSAEEPDRLRGPQFHAAWADEFCAWAPGKGDVLAMVRLGLRLSLPFRGGQGSEATRVGGAEEEGPPHPSASPTPSPEGEGEFRPQLVVTTTPRPTRALKRLMGEASCVTSRAGTEANAKHLAAGFVESLRALYGGTRLEAQEIEGQVVDDGLALFPAEMLAGARGAPSDRWDRVVVGVDPSVTAGGNACGIVVVGRVGEACEVLADRTVGGVSPEAWARAVVAAAEDHGAAEVVVEVNQGGELVTGLLKAVGAGLAVTPVRASVGKRARAEPVAALYEQGRVRHVGAGLERLEEELMAVGDEAGDLASSLDRADALVWAVTHLMLGEERGVPRVRVTGGERRRWGLAGEPTACAGPVEGWLSEPEPWPKIR